MQVGQAVAAEWRDSEVRDDRNDAIELEGLERARVHG
jgi:hypothetical protein